MPTRLRIQPGIIRSYPLFLSHIAPFWNQNGTDSAGLGLNTCLVPKFGITIPSCYCTAVISTFCAILSLPVDLACLKIYMSAFLSRTQHLFGSEIRNCDTATLLYSRYFNVSCDSTTASRLSMLENLYLFLHFSQNCQFWT